MNKKIALKIVFSLVSISLIAWISPPYSDWHIYDTYLVIPTRKIVLTCAVIGIFIWFGGQYLFKKI